MGCCATGYVQSKSEGFMVRILESSNLKSYDFKDLKTELEMHFLNNLKKQATYIEAQQFISQNFYYSENKSDDLAYHEQIFKDLLLLIYKPGGNETLSVYWLLLLIFPILKEKIENKTINVPEKFTHLHQLLVHVNQKPSLTFADLREKITIYLKGILLTIFKSIHKESKNHILSVELTKDLDTSSKTIYTESNVEAFINEYLIKRNSKAEEGQVITDKDMGDYLFPELLFYNDLLVMFNDFINMRRSKKD